jgi:hypothetical protein
VDWEKIFREFRIVCGALFLLVLTVQAVRLPDLVSKASPLKNLDAALIEAHGVVAEIRALTATISKDYWDPKDPESGLYWNIVAMLESSTAASRTSEEMIEDIRAALIGGKDTRGKEHAGVLPTTTEGLTSVVLTAETARNDLDRVAASLEKTAGAATETLKPLRGALENIEKLSADLEVEMAAGGSVKHTVDGLARSVDDFDKLISNPDIARLLAGSAKTSEGLAGAAESIDVALRPWRKKAALLKTVIGKIIGIIRIDPTKW